MSSNAWLILAGVVLVLLGVLIRWRTARYSLKDAAIESAWALARGERTAENPTALEAKLHDVQAWKGKAGKAASTVAGHFIAQVSAVLAIAMVVGGVLLALLGIFWR
jgi:hypothetical protein